MLLLKGFRFSLGVQPAEPEAKRLLESRISIKVGIREIYHGDVIDIAAIDKEGISSSITEVLSICRWMQERLQLHSNREYPAARSTARAAGMLCGNCLPTARMSRSLEQKPSWQLFCLKMYLHLAAARIEARI